MTHPYPSPRAAIELVALGLAPSEAKSVIRSLPSFVSDGARTTYLGNLLFNRGHDLGLGGARVFCERFGFVQVAR